MSGAGKRALTVGALLLAVAVGSWVVIYRPEVDVSALFAVELAPLALLMAAAGAVLFSTLHMRAAGDRS